MFRVEHNVPDVYVNESRDFQLFSRLYDLVLQSSRFSIDSMEQVSDTLRCNDTLLPLIATKVGFFTDLKLTSKADRKILSAFPYIIKYKGSMYGIQLVTNLFEQIMNTQVDIDLDSADKNHVTIMFEDYTPDVNLIYSLLEYIRPTGLLIDYKVYSNVAHTADYATSDEVTVRVIPAVSHETGKESGVVAQVFADNEKNCDIASNVGFTQIFPVTVKEEVKTNEG